MEGSGGTNLIFNFSFTYYIFPTELSILSMSFPALEEDVMRYRELKQKGDNRTKEEDEEYKELTTILLSKALHSVIINSSKVSLPFVKSFLLRSLFFPHCIDS